MTVRTVTYPAESVKEIADLLQEWDWYLDSIEATDRAFSIVTMVVDRVDRLRERERGES